MGALGEGAPAAVGERAPAAEVDDVPSRNLIKQEKSMDKYETLI